MSRAQCISTCQPPTLFIIIDFIIHPQSQHARHTVFHLNQVGPREDDYPQGFLSRLREYLRSSVLYIHSVTYLSRKTIPLHGEVAKFLFSFNRIKDLLHILMNHDSGDVMMTSDEECLLCWSESEE